MKTNSTYTFVWIEYWRNGSGDISISRENPYTGHQWETLHDSRDITPSSYARLFHALITLNGTLEAVQSMEADGRNVLSYYHRPSDCVKCWSLDWLYDHMGDSDWCAGGYTPMTEFAIRYRRYQAAS